MAEDLDNYASTAKCSLSQNHRNTDLVRSFEIIYSDPLILEMLKLRLSMVQGLNQVTQLLRDRVQNRLYKCSSDTFICEL